MTDVLARGSRLQDDLDRGSREADADARLRVRGPAYAVMIECLRVQASSRPQSPIARILGFDPIQSDARNCYRGALGEFRAEKSWANLPTGWTVLTAAETDDGTPAAEHLVIGPGGVFTIGTKDHSGQRVWVGGDNILGETLLVNGRRTNHLRDARFEASRAARLLSSGVGDTVNVTPVIAVVDPGSITIKASPEGFLVVSSARLVKSIARSKRVLSDERIAQLVAVARFGGAWRTAERKRDETVRYEERFLRLKKQVDAARTRRIGWATAAALALVSPLGVMFSVSATSAFGAMLP